MRVTKDETGLCALLEFNISEEAKARKYYYELIEKYGYLLSRAEMEEFEEIIAEELKHTELLNRMIRRRNGILPEN